MTAGELARKAGLTTGGVTTVLDRLERAGLARRVEDPADRRRVLVERTPAAERFAADAFGPLVAASQTVMQRYSTEELELILDFLRRSRAVTEAHAVALRAADLAPPQGDVAPGIPRRVPGLDAEAAPTSNLGEAVDRVRMGIVGVGNIADMNVPGYLAHDRCDVVALCDPREEKVRAKAAEWGVPKMYTDLDAFLADDEIDAVEILTPTHMHKDHVIAAARAGKHISCQKPMANSVADAREMMAAVEEAGVTFRVTECACHYGPLVKAKELIAAGRDRDADDGAHQDRRRPDRHRVPERPRDRGLHLALQRAEPGRSSVRRRRPQVRDGAVAVPRGDPQRAGGRAPGPAVLRDPDRGAVGVRPRRPPRHHGGHVRAEHVHAQRGTTAPTSSSRSRAPTASSG